MKRINLGEFKEAWKMGREHLVRILDDKRYYDVASDKIYNFEVSGNYDNLETFELLEYPINLVSVY